MLNKLPKVDLTFHVELSNAKPRLPLFSLQHSQQRSILLQSVERDNLHRIRSLLRLESRDLLEFLSFYSNLRRSIRSVKEWSHMTSRRDTRVNCLGHLLKSSIVSCSLHWKCNVTWSANVLPQRLMKQKEAGSSSEAGKPAAELQKVFLVFLLLLFV